MTAKIVFLSGLLGLILRFDRELYSIGHKIFFSHSETVGAFAGAFFAFIFYIVGDEYRGIRERRKKNRNALVKLEYQLNEYLATMPNNIGIMKQMSEVLGQGGVYFPPFKVLSINKNILTELTNIVLINELFAFHTKVFNANEFLADIKTNNAELLELRKAEKISPEAYKSAREMLANELLEGIKYFEAIDAETEKLMAKVQVLYKLREKTHDVFLKKIFGDDRYPKELEQLLTMRVAELKQERIDGNKSR